MLAITGASGRLGSQVVSAIFEYNLISPEKLVLCTSSDPSGPRWDVAKQRGAHVRSADFDDKQSMVKAFSGCAKLLLISTPRIQLDFNDASFGQGREKHHFDAIDAAQKAGVLHVYYTSLAFGSHSKAGVMVAHNRTEDYLQNSLKIGYTIIREGIYNETWPLYLGYYDTTKDDRTEVLVAGDGPISWTSIEDLGLGNALVVTDDPKKYNGKILYLSSGSTCTIQDVANALRIAQGRDLRLKIVGKEEYVRYYTTERRMEEGLVRWWASAYDAINQGECDIKDDTLQRLIHGRESLETVLDKVKKMVA